MSSRRCGLTLLAGLLIGGAALLAPQGARANLSFTKQTGRGCDTCHAYGETPTKETVNQTGLNFYACKQDKGCILQWLAALPPETPPGRSVSQPPAPDPVPQPAPMPAPMPARTDAGLPAGTYLHTCINSRMVDGVLSADCRRADQTLRSTSLADPFGCSGQITNDDGRLHCAAGQQQVSGGAMWGAIAVADAKGDRPGQVDRWGAGRGATRGLAVADALARCQGNGYGGCDIKITYQGQCGAYASSKKHAGQGIGPSSAMASQAALDDCGKRSCRIAVTACASDQ